MGFYSEDLIRGVYECPKCKAKMELEYGDSLVCPNCGYCEDLDHHGLSDEEYEALYPVLESENWEKEEDNEYGETYDEVYNELSHDD